MPDRLRVLVADDHRMFREALERSLADVYDVVPGGSTIAEVDAAFRRGGFDVAILDLSWGTEGSVNQYLPRWYGMQPAVRVIIVTAIDEWFLGQAMLEGGAHGFLGKRSDFAEVFDAVDAVAKGETYMGRDLHPPPRRSPRAANHDLPIVALRILEFLAHGLNRNEIAKALHIDVRTVDYHIGSSARSSGLVVGSAPNGRSSLHASARRPPMGLPSN
ncbi:MAG: response regulator transcription factor [Gemmatimonadetes bacterium]|nr:response regulator transcription factor [Gemmatimonadota bacterium]